jgi:hypothetical protein
MNAGSESQAVRSISWRDVCPWLILFRTFRLAVSLPILLLATGGALLTPLGWRISELLFVGDVTDPYFGALIERNGRWPDVVSRPEELVSSQLNAEPGTLRLDSYAALPAVYVRFVDPFRRLADGDFSVRRTAYYLFGGMWNVAVWALLAGMITRLAAVQLGREQRLRVGDALRHARRNYGWYFAAPFFPLAGVILTTLPLAVLGLLMRTSLGVLLAGLLWILVLVAGLAMAILLLGLMFGWPLLWPTISSDEGSDAFEAFSRSYSYTFQRPLEYLFYALLMTVFGGLCWLLVSRFTAAVIELSAWATSWGAGGEGIRELLEGQPTGLAALGAHLIGFFNTLVLSMAAGFNYALFFCAATGVYLLLRRQVDETELDEVFLEEETPHGYGMPPAWGEETSPVETSVSGEGDEQAEP